MKKVLVGVIAGVVLVLIVQAIMRRPGEKDTSLGTAGPAPSGSRTFMDALKKEVTVNIDRSPGGERLTLQYAVQAICEAAGVPYQWQKSANLAEPERRNWVAPVHMSNTPADKAITDILAPVGLKFDVDDNGLYLHK